MESHPTNTISFERVIMLIKRFLYMRKKMLLTGAVISLVLLILIGLLSLIGPSENQQTLRIISSQSLGIMTFVGAALSSVMFIELNSQGSAIPYLTLPVSSGDKLIAAGLISYVAYTAVGLSMVYVFSLIVGLNSDWFLSEVSLRYLLNYMTIQSVFLFGSVYFRANNFLSTFLSVLVFFSVFALISYLMRSYNLNPLAWFSGTDKLAIVSFRNSSLFLAFFHSSITAFFLWMTYRRLQTRQVA